MISIYCVGFASLDVVCDELWQLSVKCVYVY